MSSSKCFVAQAMSDLQNADSKKVIAVLLLADALFGLFLFRTPKPTIVGDKVCTSDEPERIKYEPNYSFSSDLQVLRSMMFADIKGTNHQEVLESFYETQAHLYDSYRFRMLHGRFPMIKSMPAPKGGCWVDMGGGTGSNLEYFGAALSHWGKVVVLDLCPSLVKVAEKRVEQHAAEGWTRFASVVLGDACNSDNGIPSGSVDVVTFSYALTMIPDWKEAIRNAYRMLKVGGHIAVCDFTVLDSHFKPYAWLWKYIFSHDHVYLREEHIKTLSKAFDQCYLEVGAGTFPYIPRILQCPYYAFVGKKTSETCPV